MKRIALAGLLGAAAALAPAGAQAAPAPAMVTVTCDVYAQQFGNMLASFAGTVHGTGPNPAAARANAESKIWGPYGSMPYVANCR
ncbi:hypothetical protein GCM10009551_095710 [Nocardiopsis tropica]|uniref:hypothetical protein n=1 Tax=Tsukamurella strandjordii TaxID=147577 RepID=UPI0031D2F2EE